MGLIVSQEDVLLLVLQTAQNRVLYVKPIMPEEITVAEILGERLPQISQHAQEA